MDSFFRMCSNPLDLIRASMENGMIETQTQLPNTWHFEFELDSAEEFKTDLTWPTSNADIPCSVYIDGILIKSDLCDCPDKLLFEFGCQCGGI